MNAPDRGLPRSAPGTGPEAQLSRCSQPLDSPDIEQMYDTIYADFLRCYFQNPTVYEPLGFKSAPSISHSALSDHKLIFV